jgi:hypothetical protein
VASLVASPVRWLSTAGLRPRPDPGRHQSETACTSSELAGSASITITVSDGSGGGGFPISLTVVAYKVRGAQYADLAWSGATSTNVDVYRDGGFVMTTANDGAYTDVTGQKGGGGRFGGPAGRLPWGETRRILGTWCCGGPALAR